ncbi:uncharacterized protein KY384_006541 [Bacidia gigantensis]|uniref:uncharacterized protein n=1 Tax=Bacidia gigantensis TaxID=2732470 RepID=UPI001D0599EF|nr:uncharacterized protein KY384_006541 [Bacidia gigantensis]KAG8528852.1 hypothetical protein KY384_006541 [Bacidia gigantensis]
MRSFHHPSSTIPTLLLLLPCLTTAISIDCKNILVDKFKYDFSPLDGPHSVSTVKENGPRIRNTTFTINPCRRLQKTKGVPKEEDCQNGSHVCAITRLTNKIEEIEDKIEDTVSIAGEFSTSTGGSLDPKWTRLKTSSSTADREKDGLRLEMHGGKDDDGKKQKAIVEFICRADSGNDDRRRHSTISTTKDEDDDEDDKDGDEKDDDKGGDKSGEIADDENGGKLKYVSWEDEGKYKVLRLEWNTKYACEDAKTGSSNSTSSHWGFFTWFIIVVFLGIAAYLIFGSWLNYNRYSARGWDLLPHSDTIRDIPYLFKDLIRRIMDTFQGTHTRHGYSAV